MRYKVICCIAILLVAAPLLAQEVTPFLVETLKSTSPTTIITGEPFKQTYRVRYLNLEESGKEVIFWGEEAEPKSLPVAPFEVLKLEKKPDPKKPKPIYRYKTDGERYVVEYVWDLEYTLRIINPKKGPYKIPSFNFYWSLKEGGIDIQQVKKNPFPTEEVYINYITTITQDPYLDIRDNIDFGTYSRRATVLWYISRVLTPIVFLAPFIWFIFSAKIKVGKAVVSPSRSDEQDYIAKTDNISFGKAYRDFFFDIERLASNFDASISTRNDPSILLVQEKKIATLIRDVLRAKLEKVNPGDTPADIKAYIEGNIKDGIYKSSLMALAERLVDYDRDVQSGGQGVIASNGSSLFSDLEILKRSVRLLTKRGIVRHHIKKYIGRSN